MALREPAGVVLGIAPWNAPIILGVRAIADAARLRQYGHPQGLASSARAPIALIGEALREAGFPHGVVNVVTNAPEDAGEVVERADRRIRRCGASISPARPRVGRIVAETRGRASEAGAARAGRQGAADRARRRRPRRSGEGGGVRRVHEPGPDLHVDRADHRRRSDRRCVCAQKFAAKARACLPAIRARATRARLAGRPEAVDRVTALIDDALAQGRAA